MLREASLLPPPQRPPQRAVGLLVVEDEKTVRQGFAKHLRGLKHKVRSAVRGPEAVRMASSPDIQIILLDIRMPGRFDGLEAARQIQSMYPGKGIIIVSVLNNEEYHQKARDLGLRDLEWVEKPRGDKGLESLLDAIDRMSLELDKRRLRKIWESEEAQGLERGRVLRLVKKLEPSLSEAVEDLTREIFSSQSDFVKRLRGALAEIRASFTESDIQERQMAFGPFKEEVLGAPFWNLFEYSDRNHRRMAIQLRMALRKLSSLDLEEKHLAALDVVLERLAQAQVTEEEVMECERVLRRQGIEAFLDLGPQRERLLQIYREEID